MRTLIALGVLIAILAVGIEASSAQNRPWCLRSGFTGPGWCGFDTFEQCWATAQGQGGSCIENNMLLWQRQQQKGRKQQRQQSEGWRWSDGWRW